MNKWRRQILASVTALASAAAIVAAVDACSETGPDAPARQNGCLNEGCAETGVGGPGPVGPGVDAGPDAPPIVYPHPLDGTTMEATQIRGGFQFVEGPVWIGGRLLFTDIPRNLIVELNAAGNNTSTFRNNTNGANGLAVDATGRLLVCEGGARRITRGAAASGSALATIVDVFGNPAKKFNSPNDLIVRADGNIYFTDPNYGGADGASNQLPYEGAYRIDKLGITTRLAGTFGKANGIALSPNGATLYIVDNGNGKLRQAPVDGDGAVGDFADLADVPGGDGMAVDDAGNLYVADDAGIDVFDKAGAKLGTIDVPLKPSNCTFGGTDRKTLFITSNGPTVTVDGGQVTNPGNGLYKAQVNVPGLP